MDNFESDLDDLLELYAKWMTAESNYYYHSPESLKKMSDEYHALRSWFLKYAKEPDGE